MIYLKWMGDIRLHTMNFRIKHAHEECSKIESNTYIHMYNYNEFCGNINTCII